MLSSADTFINNASGFFARVFCAKLWPLKQEESQGRMLLLWSRLFAVIVTVLGAGLAWAYRDIVDLLVGAFGLLLIYLPVVLGTFVPAWRKEPSAFYGTIIGLAVFAVLFAFWNPKMAFAPAVLVSIGAYAIIGGLTKTSQP